MFEVSAEQRALAEAVYGTLNSGDLEAFLALIAEDVEFTSMVAEAEGTVFRGHDGVRTWWATVRGAFEDVHWELLDIHGTGDLGVLHFRMSGTLGGVPVEPGDAGKPTLLRARDRRSGGPSLSQRARSPRSRRTSQ